MYYILNAKTRFQWAFALKTGPLNVTELRWLDWRAILWTFPIRLTTETVKMPNGYDTTTSTERKRSVMKLAADRCHHNICTSLLAHPTVSF